MDNFIGWEVQLKNGIIMREGTIEWKNVPKKDIVRLSLCHYNGRRWDLIDKEAYFIKIRVSMVPGIKESHKIERRSIGYYEGAKKICYHVYEDTGRFELEVIDNSHV